MAVAVQVVNHKPQQDTNSDLGFCYLTTLHDYTQHDQENISSWDSYCIHTCSCAGTTLDQGNDREFHKLLENYLNIYRNMCPPSGRDGHGTSPPEYLQLDRCTLHTSNSQGHSPVVDLIVTVLLQQGVGNLGQTKSFPTVYK